MDAGHCERGGLIGTDEDVRDLFDPRCAEHRGDGVDVEYPAALPDETPGLVHDLVHQRDEEGGRGAAHRHRNARRQVQPGRHAVPSVQIDAQEDRLGKEGVPLQREGQAHHFTERVHEPWPEQSELEREHRPGHRPHREQHGGALRQPLAQLQIVAIAGAAVEHVRGHE